MRAPAAALIVSHLAVAGGVYALVDRRPVDTVARQDGFFRVETTKVLSATVDSLRAEGRLQVFSYKGSARVEADRTVYWFFHGHQELTVPAVVPYHLDLAAVTLADVSYDPAARLVRVRLPPVTVGDIAFQPEAATATSGGVLTWSEDQVEALRRLNYAAARRAMVAQSQQAGLVAAVRRQAVADVEQLFAIPLRAAGQPDVKVVASFG